MATAKTTTLTFRIEPDLKEALRAAADREHRSISKYGGGDDQGLLRAHGCRHPQIEARHGSQQDQIGGCNQ